MRKPIGGFNIEQNDQFEQVLSLVHDTSKHLFVTGNAGTGKSTLLRYVRESTHKNCVVVSPTGLAALNVGGQTIHSFFLFPHTVTIDKAREIGLKRKKDKLIQSLELLIIDEVSMVRSDLLDAMDIMLKVARDSMMPFGGVQVVCFGDLLQLPPVIKRDEVEAFSKVYSSHHFFASHVFDQILRYGSDQFACVELQKVYRQDDSVFISVLNAVRDGTICSDTLELINVKHDPLWHNFADSHIVVTTTNKKAHDINTYHLKTLEEKQYTYHAAIEGNIDTKNLPTQESISFKVGSRVMCIKNDQKKRYYNGSLGTIIGLYDTSVEVELDSGGTVMIDAVDWESSRVFYNDETKKIEQEVVGTFTQIPLKLAWAITIHKSQGQTFDTMILDLDRGVFSSGQTYVALSRCRSLDGLKLARPIQMRDIKTDQTVKNFLSVIEQFKS